MLRLGKEVAAVGGAVTIGIGTSGDVISAGTVKGDVADLVVIPFAFSPFVISVSMIVVAFGLGFDFCIVAFVISVDAAAEAASAASIANLAALLSLTLRDVVALGAGTKEAVPLRRDLARKLPHCFPGRQLMPREVHRAHAGQPRSQC